MGWNRAASLLILVIFLAFGFQVVGVFSQPIIRNQPSIATVGDYRYGILGWCPTDSFSGCSPYGVGYTLQDTSDTRWGGSTQKTLSSIAVVHIVAAGLLLLTFFMSCGTVWKNQRFWTAVEIMLSLSFTSAALSFAVEVVLFRANLNFAGWFTLASTILSIVAIVIFALMQKSLQISLGRTNISGKDALLTEDSVMFQRSGDFIIGRDDEKMLQGPSKFGRSDTSLALAGFQVPKPPPFKSPGSGNKYERIPESNKGQSFNQQQWPGTILGTKHGTQPNARLPQLSVSSNDSVGALPRQQQGIQQRASVIQNKMGATPTTVPSANTAAGVAAEALGAAATGASFAQSGSANQSAQSRAAHTSMISVASTQAARVPAGAFYYGFEDKAKHNTNTIQSQMAGARELKAESATLEYCKDETESKSPLTQSKVPNYSRMSAQEKASASSNSRNKGTNNVMLDRYMDSAHLAAPPQHHDPYCEAANPRADALSPESEVSQYISISEQPQQGRQDPNSAKAAPQEPSQFDPNNQAASYQHGQAQQNDPFMQYYQSSAQYSGNEASYSYYPQTQANYQYYQNPQAQYYGYGINGAHHGQPVVYGNPNDSYQGARPSSGFQAYNPAPRPKPRRQAMQRSELALQANPDFSLGNLGKKKRPGMK